NPQHVSVGSEDNARLRRDSDRAIHHLDRSHTDRTSGSMNEFDFTGQQFVDTVAHERMRLSAAHFHQHPGPRHFLLDVFCDRQRDFGIAILVDVLQAGTLPGSACDGSGSSPSSLSAPICARYEYVRWASSSSIRVSAKPT